LKGAVPAPYIAAMYNETVLDHFQNPRNTGEIADASGVGSVGNPACGDMMKLYIKVVDGRLAEVKYKTFGCAAAIATSSIASEMVKGKTIEQAEQLTREEVVEALHGLPQEKVNCSTLAPDAIRAAIADYRRRNPSRG
jgi:nitrogen fixation NifU-like protein